MIKDKKILLIAIGVFVTTVTLGIGFVITKTKNKDLLLTVNKIYFAYSSYILDMGHSPTEINELYENTTNIAKWNGPYISQTSLEDFEGGDISIVQASSIPTKKCSLDYISYCYNWLKVSDLKTLDFEKVKKELNPQAKIFFANNDLYFKLSNIE